MGEKGDAEDVGRDTSLIREKPFLPRIYPEGIRHSSEEQEPCEHRGHLEPPGL